MDERTRELIRMIVIDFILVIILVACYSPGLWNLRPSDPSIFRAGCSILAIPIAVIAFCINNQSLLHEKSVKDNDGRRVSVRVADGDILEEIDRLNERINDTEILDKSALCRSCLADIFIRVNDDDNDLTVPIVRSRLDYYLKVYVETLKRMVTLEKYSRTSLYKKSYYEISSTMSLLQEVFYKALDQILNNVLDGAELDKIVLRQMMSMDGFGTNPFEELKDKYK